jgi:hypothetical protein
MLDHILTSTTHSCQQIVRKSSNKDDDEADVNDINDDDINDDDADDFLPFCEEDILILVQITL